MAGIILIHINEESQWEPLLRDIEKRFPLAIWSGSYCKPTITHPRWRQYENNTVLFIGGSYMMSINHIDYYRKNYNGYIIFKANEFILE